MSLRVIIFPTRTIDYLKKNPQCQTQEIFVAFDQWNPRDSQGSISYCHCNLKVRPCSQRQHPLWTQDLEELN